VDTTPDIPSLLAAYYMLHPKAPIYILHPSHCSSIPDKIPSQIINCDLLQPAIDNCRVYKDAYEISLIRKANEISAAAHRRVQQLVRTAKNETELEAIFLSVCVANFAKSQAYDPICGSGRNAATLHYVKNDEPLDGRQLLLCDAGAEWEGYASDVTRTFPISGWWTQEAFAIYKLVEEMQRQCIARTIKGVDWRETHLLAHRIATKGLIELGILCGGSFDEIYCAGTSKAFFPHGLGHLMGLDVHDTEGASDVVWNSREMMGVYADIDESILGDGNVCRTLVKRVLDKDMVITVEPGMYDLPLI
jgi:Xaa-Pro dipeptidase